MSHTPKYDQADRRALLGWLAVPLFLLCGCQQMVNRTDRDVAAIIAERQQAVLGADEPAPVPGDGELSAAAPASAYSSSPHPVSPEIPAGFEPVPGQPGAAAGQPVEPTAQPAANDEATTAVPQPARLFTLTDALAYAQQNQRSYQTAKEDLYLVALALTLERHLWTPIFSSNLRTVYGNFGEITDFDQAMRFVADLSVAQRLPYGGEFTAQAISTLIRDVGQTITAEESSTIELSVSIPFLRGAGHVAREELVQLERELTYAVRVFERFRRRQLVEVARDYFNLLRDKQQVLDSATSLERRGLILERAREYQKRELGSLLDTQRAEFEYLTAENRLERAREIFRTSADNFKLIIGMPVEQPLGLENLEDIESIEKQVAAGKYPLLLHTAAVDDENRALDVAVRNRLDLLNQADRIDDARRGVAIARNDLLPDLDLTSSVTWDTDPDHYRLGGFSFDRTTWRSELVLGLPLERTSERNRYRASLIDVRRAQRDYQDTLERIRADVRSAVNQIRLEDRSLQIQQRNVEVTSLRREYAQLQYDEGDIEVRELLDAEDAWTDARNELNRAKTSGWSALLDFRLATATLRVDENGVQYAPPGTPLPPAATSQPATDAAPVDSDPQP